jgi:integrase
MARKGEKKRIRVLKPTEIRSMWVAAIQLGYPFGSIFRLLLATGQRRDEVANMKWSQLDLSEALWTIPSVGTKADRGDHLVPLNSIASEIISALPRVDGSDLLFPTSSNVNRAVSGFSKAKARCDKMTMSDKFYKADMVAVKDWRLHDLRRTMATVMVNNLGIAPHVVGAVLNHDPKAYKGITATYTVGRLLDDRKRALDAWGQKLANILNPDSENNVVPIKMDEK